MKILVVEDEHKIANSIKRGLEQEGYVVDVAYDGEVGYDLASSEPYDVVLLDLMLPLKNGMDICRDLRFEKIHTPILMLTARGELNNKVDGLNSGADDYLTKPFAFEELLARIRALTRRPKTSVSSKLTFDNLTLDTITFNVNREGKNVMLSKKEFMLLEFFMRHPNSTFTKDQIIERVWSMDSDILPNTVEVYVGYLRRKIDLAFPKSKPLIKTVRGFGYKLSL